MIIDTFAIWTKEFFTCKCADKPFCICGEINFSKKLVELRQQGYSPIRITDEFRKNYNIQIYPGDLYSWLDALVHNLNAIERLAKVLDEIQLQKSAKSYTKDIEKPKIQ